MFCTQCGSQVENEGKVCRACGAAIPQRHASVTAAQSVSAESAATNTQCEERQTTPEEGRSKGGAQRPKQRFAPFFSAWKHWSSCGRASRSEYWFGMLSLLLLMIAIYILGLQWSEFLYTFNLMLIFASCLHVLWTSRRLHDCGNSAWLILLDVLPFGLLLVWILCLRPSEPKKNRFGDIPYLES